MRAFVCLLCLLLALPVAASPPFRVDTLVEGLEHPWSLAFLPDGRTLVTERPGRLRLLADGRLHPDPIAGVPPVYARGQGGLLEVLADPDFAENQRIYLSFAHGDAKANATRVIRARLEGHGLVEVMELFTARPSKRNAVHFGGRMAFLADGTLVLGLGDGFDHREQAQRLDNHFGKIVRFRSDGSIPPDNPFLRRQGALPEIYSYGHRNVQGLAVHPQSGLLYAHEHGPRGGDELNVIDAGANYGWPVASFGVDYSGARVSPFTTYPEMTDPLWHWTPSIAPAGLAYYRGEHFPEWSGDWFVATLASKSLHRLRIRLRTQEVLQEEVLLADLGERLRDVRAAPDGSLWLLTDSPQGKILRLSAAAPAIQ